MKNRDKKEQRISQIVNATIRCIAEEGLESLTMLKVSEYSGLSRGAINHYFRKKEDILIAVIDEIDARLFAVVDEKVRDSDDEYDHIRYRLSLSMELAKTDPAFITVATEFLSTSKANYVCQKRIHRFFKKYRHLSAKGMALGLKKGNFRNVDPEAIGALILAMIFGLGIQWLVDKDSFKYKEIISVAEEMMISYLKKPE